MSRYIHCQWWQSRRIANADNIFTAVEIGIHIARDLALHGYLTQSAEVVAAVWNAPTEPSLNDFVRNTIMVVGLETIWKEAEFQPSNLAGWIPLLRELCYTDERLEIERREYFCQPLPTNRSSIPQRFNWDRLAKSISVKTHRITGGAKLPTHRAETDALQALALGNLKNADPRPLVVGLDLALKHGEKKLAINFIRKIAIQIANIVPDAARELALAPRTGRIVRRTAAICMATGLGFKDAQELTRLATRYLRTRPSQKGLEGPFARLSWESLLLEIEKREKKEKWAGGHDTEFPFIRPGASPKQVEGAGRQLGVTLPADYKEFLTVSNGLGSFNLSEVTPLLPVDKIFWDTDHPEFRVEYREFEVMNTKVASLPALDRVLHISAKDEDVAAHWWLMEPRLVRAAMDRMNEAGVPGWVGFNYAEWGSVISNRGSFRLMMERRLRFLIATENR